MFINACVTPHEIALPLEVVYLVNKPHWVIAIRILCFMFQFGYVDKGEAEPSAREKLANYAHAAWAGWMKYMFQKSVHNLPDNTVTIPASLAERWMRQMNTPYAELPENEKESDRLEADRMLEIIDS